MKRFLKRLLCLFKGHEFVIAGENNNYDLGVIELYYCNRCGEFLWGTNAKTEEDYMKGLGYLVPSYSSSEVSRNQLNKESKE